MANDYIPSETFDIVRIQTALKPWTAPNGTIRYYIDVESTVYDYREATDSHLHGYYDWEQMRANGDRVRECIEANVLPKTKAYFDIEGKLHIYGYALGPTGDNMRMPQFIAKCAQYFYGFNSEEHSYRIFKNSGKHVNAPIIGDVVRIVKGRKEVGRTFVVAKITQYQYNIYAPTTTYLWASDGFKVNMDNCTFADFPKTE